MNVDSIARQYAWLQQMRVAPLDLELSESPGPRRARADLMPCLLAAWKRSRYEQQTPPQRRHTERVLAWLEVQMAQHAALTWGVPGDAEQRVREWLGPRLVWWPRGIPPGQRIGIVSSRLGRNLEQYLAWFAALRRTCDRLDPSCSTLIAVERTTPFPFLERCSELFQLPLLRFELPTARQSAAGWFEGQLKIALQEDLRSGLTWPAWMSPPLDGVPDWEAPLRDRLVTAVSDQVVVLGMRSGGHVEQLVRRRLAERPAESSRAISLAVGPGLVPEKLAEKMPGTHRMNVEQKQTRDECSAPEDGVNNAGAIVPLKQLADTRFLTHCTRRATGPWPDQSTDDYRDALILGCDDVDHSAVATLARIASQRKLLASDRAIRGGAQVVCFTSVALHQLQNLRTFRAHRGRWDFEPYGICIAQDWLEQQGARPVCYGDASLWEQLPESQRPFFQRRRAGQRGQIDWSVECEWRHLGDVDLTDLPHDAAVLFVPTMEEAQRLCRQSRWPIVVLDDGSRLQSGG